MSCNLLNILHKMKNRMVVCVHGISFSLGFPGGSVVKNLPANAGDVDSTPGLGRSPREGNGNPLPWTEEPGGLQFMGCKRVRHDLVTKQHFFFLCF